MSDSIHRRKAEIRQTIRRLRNSISETAAQQAAVNIGKKMTQLSFYEESRQIACFLSFDGEIGTQLIIERLLQDKSLCFLPKLRPTKPNCLWFMPYQKGTPLSNSRLGIAEPDLTVNNAIAVSHLDIIFMPLVAFDEQGNRLGMGGGFYDATLAHLNEKAFIKRKPKCIGVAYNSQKVSNIPVQKWDFPLDGVLTEKTFYSFNGNGQNKD